jgi:putative SOS response-associated peptidase YedK
MCGRYRIARKKEILAEYFDAGHDVDWAPRYNVAPSQDVPVIRQDATKPVRSVSLMRWGLIPWWARDAKAGFKMINARAESVAEKPAFREPLQSRRCLVPADGFFEWAKEGNTKSPYCFARADDSVFAFAGLWDRWKTPDGELVHSCSIITTTANPLVRGIHDRMPVILERDNYDLWLDPGFAKTESVIELLKPCPPELMRSWRVSTRVNSVVNDDPACIEEFHPAPIPPEAQGTLFGA